MIILISLSLTLSLMFCLQHSKPLLLTDANAVCLFSFLLLTLISCLLQVFLYLLPCCLSIFYHAVSLSLPLPAPWSCSFYSFYKYEADVMNLSFFLHDCNLLAFLEKVANDSLYKQLISTLILTLQPS